MQPKSAKRALIVWLCLIAALLVLALIAAPAGHGGLSPGVIAGMIVTAALLIAAALIRFLAVPGFRTVPGRFQLLLEQLTAAAGHLAGLKKVGVGLVHAAAGLARGVCAAGKGLAALARKIAAIRLTKRTKAALAVWLCLIVVLLVLSLLVGHSGEHEDIQIAMKDAVLHDVNRVSLFGLKEVNPGFIAAMTVTAILLAFALIVRIFVIPRFTTVPGKFQLLLEQAVTTLDGLAKVEDPGRRAFVGAYVFAAGAYIFVGTLFELFGFQAVATSGASVTLPAPLSDVNAAICMGCMSYLVIFAGGVRHAGLHGAGATLKEFSLPISMSFRLFGALLSGLLVTDLVYHYIQLSFVVPVVVGVIFTLLHAIIQTYVLCMLVGMYYAEVSERPEPKQPKKETKTAAA